MEMGYWAMEPVARLFILFGVTANQITWASLVFGVASAFCLAAGHFGSGAFLAAITGLLDCLDGMVARRSHSDTAGGQILDSAMDRYVEFLFIGALIIYYRHVPWAQVIALLALLGSFMVSYSTAKAEAFSIPVPRGLMRRPERAVYLVIGAFLAPLSVRWLEAESAYPVVYPMIVALVLVAVLANFTAVVRIAVIVRVLNARRESETAAEAKAVVRLQEAG
jgi:CDP-diacylglycerol--glycerol-3-phosphate 3-phosphatidyltransferase